MEWFCSPRPRCKNINKAGQQKLYSNPYHLFMCAFLSVRSVCVRVHRFNAEVCAQGGVCALTCLCSSVRGGCTEQIVYYHVNAEVQIKPGPRRVY